MCLECLLELWRGFISEAKLAGKGRIAIQSSIRSLLVVAFLIDVLFLTGNGGYRKMCRKKDPNRLNWIFSRECMPLRKKYETTINN